MVSDQDIAEALESLLRESNPNNNTLNSLNGVVQQLESKLGLNLSHKVDFIRNQIHFLFRLPPPQQLPFHHNRPQPQQQLLPQQEHLALHQNPNFHPAVSSSQLPPNFAAHRPEDYVFRQAPPPVAKTEAYALAVAKTEAYVADVATTTAPPAAVAQTPAPAPEASKDRFIFCSSVSRGLVRTLGK